MKEVALSNLSYVSPELCERIRKHLENPGTRSFLSDSVERGLAMDCRDAVQDAFDCYQILLAVSKEIISMQPPTIREK